MLTTNLRKVGGSVMLAVPPAILESLDMQSGTAVSLDVKDGGLFVKPVQRPKYTLEELLSQCDPDAPFTEEDKAWLNGVPAGRELI